MFDNHLFRCSALGRLMTNGRAKNEMGETCKSYLKEVYIEQKYGFRKDFKNKYIDKGLEVEDSAIALYSSYKDNFFTKNEQRFSNEFITGMPDIITDIVIDIKSSWNKFTMPEFDDKIDKNYYYQLQGYMYLLGLKKAKIAYVLIDTPRQLIEDEKRKLSWDMGNVTDIDENILEAYVQIEKNHDFSVMPMNERVIEFDIDFDEECIEQIKLRVLEARKYLNSR